MKILHDFLHLFLFQFFLGVADAGGGGGGDGAPAPAAAAPAGGEGAAPPAGGTPNPAGAEIDIRGHLDDKGALKAGWHKAYGLPDSFAKFTRPEAAFRSYEKLERAWGDPNKVVIPGPAATDEERAAFYGKLGRPEKPEAYGFAKPEKLTIAGKEVAVPDGLWDKSQADAFAGVAYKIGLSKAQADALVQFNLEQGLSVTGQTQQAHQQATEAAIADLKKEYGGDYEANLAAAKQAAKNFGGDELVNHPALGNDPVLIRALVKIGLATKEAPGAGMRQQAGDNQPANPQAEARRLQADVSAKLKADPKYAQHPAYKADRARITELYQMANPQQGG